MHRFVAAEATGSQIVTSDSVFPGIVSRSVDSLHKLDQSFHKSTKSANLFPNQNSLQLSNEDASWKKAKNHAEMKKKQDWIESQSDPLGSKSLHPIPRNILQRRIMGAIVNAHHKKISELDARDLAKIEAIKIMSMMEQGLSPNIDAGALAFEQPDRKKLAKIRRALESGNLVPMMDSFSLPQNPRAEKSARNTPVVSSIMQSSALRSDASKENVQSN